MVPTHSPITTITSEAPTFTTSQPTNPVIPSNQMSESVDKDNAKYIVWVFLGILLGLIIIVYLIIKIMKICRDDDLRITDSRNIVVFRNPVYDTNSPNYDPNYDPNDDPNYDPNDIIYDNTQESIKESTIQHIYSTPILEPINNT